MRKQIQIFLKANAAGALWLLGYILVQTAVMVGALYYFVMRDWGFADQFLEIFEPIIAMKDGIEKQMQTYVGLETLMRGKIGYVLLISSFILVIFFLIYWKRKHKKVIVPFPSKLEYGKVISLGIIINTAITLILSMIPALMSENHERLTELCLSNGWFVDVVATGILVPIAEEGIFRFGLLRAYEKVNVRFAIIYQAVIFGTLHGNLVQGCYAFALGVFFGVIYKKTDNLLYPILLHISINLSSVLVSYSHMEDYLGLLMLSSIAITISMLQQFAISRQKI